MALGRVSKLFGVNDAAIWRLATDVAGAPPTYGTKIDVVGAKHLTAKLGMDIKQLRGDNTLLAADAVFKDISGDLSYAKFNFDLLAQVATAAGASSVVEAGTTPTQSTKVTLAQADTPASFKIEAQSKQVDYISGDVHFILFKCTASSLDMLGFDEENYNNQGISYTAFPVIGTPTGLPANSWAQALANETASAIV